MSQNPAVGARVTVRHETGIVESGTVFEVGPNDPTVTVQFDDGYGYLSHDGRWFVERGGEWEGPVGEVDPTRHLRLIWRKVDETDRIEFTAGGAAYDVTTGDYCRTQAEVTGEGGDGTLWVDTHAEGGWLSEAKGIVEKMAGERAA